MIRWKRPSRRAVLLGSAGVALFAGCLYLFIPCEPIDRAVQSLIAPQGLSLAPGCRKTLAPGLMWRAPVVSSDKGPLVALDSLTIRPHVLPLVAGKLVVGASGKKGAGEFEAVYGASGTEAFSLHAAGISLADIPFFSTVMGAKAGGELWSEGRLTRTARGLGGDIKIEVQRLALSGVRLGSFPLPDVADLRTRGMITVTGGVGRLDSFTLEGDGIYMRLSGEVPSGSSAATQPLNLVLEIMPRAEFMERQKLVFMLLAKFMASPGVYRVPIKGTLLKPEIL